MFTVRPLLYGILAHFLQGSHNEGRQFTGARQEPMLRSHTRGLFVRSKFGNLSVNSNKSLTTCTLWKNIEVFSR